MYYQVSKEVLEKLPTAYFGDGIQIEVGYVSKEQPRFEFFK